MCEASCAMSITVVIYSFKVLRMLLRNLAYFVSALLAESCVYTL